MLHPSYAFTDFNEFYNNISCVKTNYSDFSDALRTLILYKTNAVYYNPNIEVNINNDFVFTDENGVYYYYIWELPDSDIATNIYTDNNNVCIYINNNGTLIPIKTTNVINTFLLNMNKISIVIKFTDNKIPEKINLYFTGIVLSTYPRQLFINYIQHRCNFNTMTWGDNCIILI